MHDGTDGVGSLQVVFLVGSSAALGCWDTYQGIMLETSPLPRAIQEVRRT